MNIFQAPTTFHFDETRLGIFVKLAFDLVGTQQEAADKYVRVGWGIKVAGNRVGQTESR